MNDKTVRLIDGREQAGTLLDSLRDAIIKTSARVDYCFHKQRNDDEWLSLTPDAAKWEAREAAASERLQRLKRLRSMAGDRWLRRAAAINSARKADGE